MLAPSAGASDDTGGILSECILGILSFGLCCCGSAGIGIPTHAPRTTTAVKLRELIFSPRSNTRLSGASNEPVVAIFLPVAFIALAANLRLFPKAFDR